MTTKELIQANNHLREQLNPSNRKHYEELLIQMRLNGYNREDHLLEESLFELLTDLLEAQKNGQSFEDYFGKEPKLVAHAMLKELPKTSVREQLLFLLKLIAFFVVSYGTAALFYIGHNNKLSWAILGGVMVCLAYGIGTYLIFFSKLPKKKAYLLTLVIALLCLALTYLLRPFL